MAKIKITLLLVLVGANLFAQNFNYGFRVEFTDKNNSAYTVDNPLAFLSQRSIDRRSKHNIPITEEDFPVNQRYADSLTYFDAQLHNTSKWMNSALYFTNNSNFINQAQACDFVADITLVYENNSLKNSSNNHKFYEEESLADLDYGQSANQINMCKAEFLHNQNYLGQGMQVAVIDAGFSNADNNACFDSLFLNNRILGTYDFVENETSVYEDHYHGNNVLSIIAGDVPGQFLGSAPKASYWLLRSENVNSEFPVEEDYWIFAAEFADSVGADIITTSLGYSTFDSYDLNWTTDDMDGQTTFITRGAEKAFTKGIFLANSAGNEGSGSWGKITAPSDGEHILCVGAVDADGIKAAFSSFGPSADGRVKPDVMAQGQGTALVDDNGSVSFGNGTSYSCPLMAGMVTCFWQAYPDLSNLEILNLIRQSSDNYKNPNGDYGYGIPDFQYASTLANMTDLNQYKKSSIVTVYPNPATDDLRMALFVDKSQQVQLRFYNIIGGIVCSKDFYFETTSVNWISIPEIADFERGTYILSIKTASQTLSQIVIKE